MMGQFIKGFREGIRNFGENIAIIVNTILLSFVYLIAVGLTSIVAKLFRKHFLEIKLSEKSSYWSGLNLKKKLEDYYRQF